MQYNIPKDKWLERGVNNHIYDPYCKKLMASYTNVISETGCRFWQCDNPCTYPYTVNTVSKGHHKSLPCSSKSLLLVFPLVHLDQPILCIGLVMFFFMTASRNVHPIEYLLYICLLVMVLEGNLLTMEEGFLSRYGWCYSSQIQYQLFIYMYVYNKSLSNTFWNKLFISFCNF